jgi:hypothetical protein
VLTRVERQRVVQGGPRVPHLRAAFEDEMGDLPLAELTGRGQTPRACADHENWNVGWSHGTEGLTGR